MTRMTQMIYCPAEMKEIKESAFGTGCAQERSNYFCDFLYFLRPFGSCVLSVASATLRDVERQAAKPSAAGQKIYRKI